MAQSVGRSRNIGLVRPLLLVAIFLFLSYVNCFSSGVLAQPAVIPKPVRYFSAEVNTNRQMWYGKHLSAMGESPIWDLPKPSDKFIFRFLWLRSFHHPICVRVERNKDGTAFLYGKELSGRGGYAPGTMIVDRHIPMSDDTVKELMEKLKAVNYFEQPTTQDTANVTDGAQWIFEANDNGQYHLIDCFGARGMRDIGVFLLKQAGLLPEKHVY